MALAAFTATAQYQFKHAPSLQDKLNPHHLKITEQVVKNDAVNPLATGAQKARAEQATHQVNFMLDYTENQYVEFFLVNRDRTLYYEDLDLWELTQGTNIASVPDGTYDVIFIFYEMENKGTAYENTHHILYVIREQVTIDQDMQLDVSSTEAKNHIHVQTLTIDGEPVNTGTAIMDENWWVTPVELGNTDDVFYQNKICCRDYGEVIHDSGRFGRTIEVGNYHISNGECKADFYVNDVSDRYVFGSYRIALDLEDNIYTSYKEVQGVSGDVTIANDPSKFRLYENQFTVTQHQNENMYRGFSFWLKKDGEVVTYHYGLTLTGRNIDEGEVFKYYISASAEESKVGYIPYIVAETDIETSLITPWGGEMYVYRPIMISGIITNTNEDVVFANSGNDNKSYDGNLRAFFYQEWDETGQFVKMHSLWPSHPIFTYKIDKKKDKLGNNCPLLTTNPRQYATNGNVINYMNYHYQGRYGEVTLSHRDNAEINLIQNGEIVYEGPGYIIEGLSEGAVHFDNLFDGVVDATITTPPFKVDDLDGSNKAQLHYTAGAEDETPPTMTMMHFRDNNGDVTDRFATAEDGTVEFSVADFNFFYTPDRDYSYFRHAPETVEVSYSPYGEDNWNELAVEELPEYYYPAMGWFYRGSLAGVTGQAEKGWFDLKFRLEDAAGNWQEQVVSPAFRIDDLAYSSVATIGSGDAHEVARYSIDGKRVDASHHGVTIIRMSDGTAKKVIQ